ncbi:hypothetical protein DH2020_001701 [Rehmannia glutinosa]|uniref:Protein kinase domain-containing protein n=1 Tax=Rehmannia glutinosa TaxID=99300 RepID=A0ABR0XRN2_REHGL
MMNISLLLSFALLLISTVADNSTDISFTEAAQISKPGCPSKCGNLTVPYPFGIGVNASCSINPFFDINCNTSFDPPKAFLSGVKLEDGATLEVLGILDTKIRVRNQISWACFDQQGNMTQYGEFSMDMSMTPFSISSENKLTVVGCDDISLLSRADDELYDFISSCVAVCLKPQDLSNGSCSGIGCCQSSIPRGLQSIYGDIATLNRHTKVQHFNPCGYSFLAEQNSYTFNTSDILDSSFVNRTFENVPLVIDWAIGNMTCNQLRNNNEMIICQGESECVDSGTTLGGYRCNCSRISGESISQSGLPSHAIQKQRALIFGVPLIALALQITLVMAQYMALDVFVPPPTKTALYAGLLVGSGLFLTLAGSFLLYKLLKKRRVKQLKQNFFKRNGSLLLQQQMSGHDSVLEKMRIFTSKELDKATDRFSESRILGRGGQGAVYKGMLSDGRIVAVKKSRLVNEDQLIEFINEVFVLSQVNHRNVVNLLGCCLETEIPLLVYEFIANGTLYQLIHDDTTGFPFSWDLRLRIAAEIANALSYLHYATSIPIYHRDMKSNNILLDEKYRAKLSDFGISRSVAIDQTHLTTKVKGTFGYLDPEYFQTGKFTEKSDVYSFGVVLVELLTGQKPISTTTTEEERSLVTRFLITMEENRLKTILDSRIIEQGVKDEHIVVANLAKRCLNLKGKRRPTIREVAMELESIRTSENPSFIDSGIQDICCTKTST